MTRFRLIAALCAIPALSSNAVSDSGSTAQPAAPNVQLASVSAVAAAVDSGEILLAKHADAVLPIASVTKLMTAMVVLDSGVPLDEWLSVLGWENKISKNAYSRIRIGSEAKRRDLLKIALMSSENLASHTLGRHHPGGLPAFVQAMNAKAESIGMTRSRFVDPTGLSPQNRSTAQDLAKMVQAAFQYPVIREFSTTRQHSVSFRGPRYGLHYGNTNPLTGSSRWNVALSKTGYLTEAGRCLVMVTEAAGETIAMVLLNSFGSRSPLGDAGRIRRWLETGFGGRVAGPARDYERRMIESYGLGRQRAGN